MNMLNKVCKYCGTTNLPNADFCVNCGARLESTKAAQENNFERNDYVHNAEPEQENHQNGGYTVPPYNVDFDPMTNMSYAAEEGRYVTDAELRRFVFKKPEKIMQKFAAMEMGRSKTSWHWPMFWLTLIFGFAGSAFWFFYRKMNKIGAILLAVAVVFSLGVSTLSGEISAMADVMDQMIDSFGTLIENPENAQGFEEAINNALMIESSEYSLVTELASLVELAAAIVMPIFCLGIYKKHCIRSIIKIRGEASSPVMSYTMYNQLGGTSSTAVILSILVFTFGTSILETILMFIL